MTKAQFAGAAMAALMAASLGACQPAAPAQPTVDTAKVADIVKADATQRIADVNAHDAAKAASHEAPDAVWMFHGRANEVGPAAIQAGIRQYLAERPDFHVTMSGTTVEVAASGDLAVIHATTVGTFTDAKTKKQVSSTNNYLAGYRPQADGSWKREWTIVSDVGPPSASAAGPQAPDSGPG